MLEPINFCFADNIFYRSNHSPNYPLSGATFHPSPKILKTFNYFFNACWFCIIEWQVLEKFNEKFSSSNSFTAYFILYYMLIMLTVDLHTLLKKVLLFEMNRNLKSIVLKASNISFYTWNFGVSFWGDYLIFLHELFYLQKYGILKKSNWKRKLREPS